MSRENGHEPATKADLDALEKRVTEATKALEKRVTESMKADLDAVEKRVTEAFAEAVHDSETRLLKAFYGFTESVQIRFKAADDAETSMKKRLNTLEERLLEVEKRLNMPGQ